MALDAAVFRPMRESPLLVLSDREIERLAQHIQTPDDLARALWEYGAIVWHRGRRLERDTAAQAAMRPWTRLRA